MKIHILYILLSFYRISVGKAIYKHVIASNKSKNLN